MKVIDARSGREVKIGDTIDWGDGEQITLLDVDPGLFSASAIVRITHRDHSKSVLEPSGESTEIVGYYNDGRVEAVQSPLLRVVKPGPLVTIVREIPLQVKWTHPRFFFQHVAFIAS